MLAKEPIIIRRSLNEGSERPFYILNIVPHQVVVIGENLKLLLISHVQGYIIKTLLDHSREQLNLNFSCSFLCGHDSSF